MRNTQVFLHNSEKLVRINTVSGSVVEFFHQYSNGVYPREIQSQIIHAYKILESDNFNTDDFLSLKKQIEQQIDASRAFKEHEAREREKREQEALEVEWQARQKIEREARELIERKARDKERETREREARQREAKEREAKEREAKEREAKEREAKEREAKEREAKERRILVSVVLGVIVFSYIEFTNTKRENEINNKKINDQILADEKENSLIEQKKQIEPKKRIDNWLNGSEESNLSLEGYGQIKVVHDHNIEAYWEYEGWIADGNSWKRGVESGVKMFGTFFDNPKDIYQVNERFNFFWDRYGYDGEGNTKAQQELEASIWFLQKFKEWAVKFNSLENNERPERFVKQIVPTREIYSPKTLSDFGKNTKKGFNFYFIFQRDLGPALLMIDAKKLEVSNVEDLKFEKKDFTRVARIVRGNSDFCLYQPEDLYLAEAFVLKFLKKAMSIKDEETLKIHEKDSKRRAEYDIIEKKIEIK